MAFRFGDEGLGHTKGTAPKSQPSQGAEFERERSSLSRTPQ